jgi:hypothetical protein
MANIPSLPVLSPKDWCPWDGIHDDLPGFNAMLATIAPRGPFTALIELPYGMGYFSDDLIISATVQIEGRNGGDRSFTSGFKFAPGKGLFLLGYFEAGSTGAIADSTKINNVSFQSQLLMPFYTLDSSGAAGDGIAEKRLPCTFYEKGRCVYDNTPYLSQSGSTAKISGASGGVSTIKKLTLLITVHLSLKHGIQTPLLTF